jgi:hypothetical protein
MDQIMDQANFSTDYETITENKKSVCSYANEATHKGSTLRKCSIGGNTSCEHFNHKDAVKCFVKINHENSLFPGC